MRLSRIKIAGFKSFVDPTTLHLPSALNAIVGPNGCGKSNLIDAVRWVLGESSARQLRGDAMADVIFSGSSARKPVGQASVELVFDNSSGKLGGQWAAYSEISVRRLVTRDGQSQYFLNGSRCRRRDITDLFLGTGLGPRSYAIIEQGMISRVVEARAEDLRAFIEEAAGISRYRERRRETEAHIERSRENLARLNDVRLALDEQLNKLERQVRQALQYQDWRAQQQRLQGELLCLRWRTLHTECQQLQQQLTAVELNHSQQLLGLNTLEEQLAQRQQQRQLSHDHWLAAQTAYQQHSHLCQSVQQQQQHAQQLAQQLQRSLQQLQASVEHSQHSQQHDHAQLDTLKQRQQQLEPQLELYQARQEQLEEQLEALEQQRQQLQEQFEQQQRQLSDTQRQLEREQTQIVQGERQQLQDQRRYERLRLELSQLNLHQLSQHYQQLQSDLHDARQQVSLEQQRATHAQQQLEQLNAQQLQLDAQREQQRTALEVARGRLSALQTLHTAAHAQGPQQWNSEHLAAPVRPVLEQLQVAAGWETAVEVVLGQRLQALAVEQPQHYAAALLELTQGQVYLLQDGTAHVGQSGLAAQVVAPPVVLRWLESVQLAPDWQTALAQQPYLSAEQSIITPEGLWLGADWIQFSRDAWQTSGALQRSRELQQLQQQLPRQEQQLAALEQQLTALAEQRQQQHAQWQHAQQQLHLAEQALARYQGSEQASAQRLSDVQQRAEQIHSEQNELQQQLSLSSETLAMARLRLEEWLEQLEQLQQVRQQHEHQRSTLRSRYEQQRTQVHSGQRELEQIRLELERLRSQQQHLQQTLTREQHRQHSALQQQTALQQELQLALEQAASLEDAQQQALQQLAEHSQGLEQAQRTLAADDAELVQLERRRTPLQRQYEQQQQDVMRLQLQLRELSVRSQSVEQTVQEGGWSMTELLESLTAQAQEALWQQQIEQLERRIQRLGPINLAAVDEQTQLLERKHYLDSQNADLLTALEALESAMRKMDRETRARFRQTFEQINTGLGRLFPRLFGGGEAQLVLTEEDPLNAGVALLAKPPGKRVGSIHLLSGGEKALTAVALVFAIFQLNPAPFCMLDEVDAPLDEANVGRFGALVRDLAQQVQFIFITHNKATMEIAQHLTGVTMHEPGVSRLVAVDVDAALQLVDSRETE